MSLWDLTVPNLFAYIVVSGLLARAVAHIFAARDAAQRLHAACEDFEREMSSYLQTPHVTPPHGSLLTRLHQLPRHPSRTVLIRVLEEPETAQDDLAVTSWILQGLQAELGSLRTQMDRLRSVAPVVGISGTISGLMIGTWTFGHTQDQRALLTSIALALVTTLVAGGVVLIERWMLEGTIKPLLEQSSLHAQATAARGRVLLRSGVRQLQDSSHQDRHQDYRQSWHEAAA